MILVLLACTCLLQAAAAGDSTQFKRWALGINVSPDWCYKSPSYNGKTLNDGKGNNYVAPGSREISKLGVTAGFNVNFFLKKKFALCLGIQYANKGYRSTTDLSAWTGVWITPNSNDPAFGGKYRYTYSYHNINIPMSAMLLLGNRKLQGLVSAGAAIDILLKETVRVDHTLSDGTVKHYTNKYDVNSNIFNLSPFASAGISYKVSPKIGLRAEAIGRCTVYQVRDQYVYGNLVSLGINIGCFVYL